MAVYTDVAEQELEDFLRNYSVGELLSYKGIAEGTENSNFLMHTSTSPFILTLYERRVNTSDLPFFLGLMEHLSNKGISCPLPVKRSDGNMIGELAGRQAALITFLEGMWKRKPSADNCRQVGIALAQLHLAGADFPMSRPNALSPSGWLEIWQRCHHLADDYMSGLEAELDGEFEAIRGDWPTSLPSGIIHADLFPDNVFFLGESLSGLIDFYFACNDFLAYDVAICLNAWCFERDATYNLTKGAALLAGYQSVRPFSPDEVTALPVLARGAALRFLLTRLHDWLMLPDGPLIIKRDPMDYLRRMRFHRQITNASEYGLKPA